MELIPSAFELRHAGKPCPYCAVTMNTNTGGRPTRDHVFPRSRGFKFNHLEGRNQAIVCQSCNADKKHYDIFQWLKRLQSGGDRRAKIVALFIEKELKLKDGDPVPPPRTAANRLVWTTGETAQTKAIVAAWERAWQKIEEAAKEGNP